MPAKKSVGLLVMAYGSPNSLDEIEPYLLDIRAGRATSAELIAEITGRYQAIGGRSPLLEITRMQAQSLAEELNKQNSEAGFEFRPFIGMRHWEPRIKDAVDRMIADGIEEVLALVMAPHRSMMSTGAYFSKLDQVIQEAGGRISIVEIQNWHTHPAFLNAIIEKIQDAFGRFYPQIPFILFTAHSLPARILAQGDPYEQFLRETAGLLSEKLGLEAGRWQFCYQSAGQSQEPWLGPPIEKVITDLIRARENNILVVPIGFVSDHIEILYDLDIVCRQLAEKAGVRLERTESLNASPAFIHALAEICQNAMAELSI